MNDEAVIKVNDVRKRYKLGTIGGGTLSADLQSWWARVRHKPDPNIPVGMSRFGQKGTFMALNGVSFEVKRGEAVGIIGGNGAGKSTLLKLLSRVTAPTSGSIEYTGRIASMLEVGTGFHPELTGRENVYLNGAILGMTRSEVDRKIEQIIDFSECRPFIDTPVKRYSSGMYVKLAFSVAAHLDSEILLMDEVLAVGDMAFQHKCIRRMLDLIRNEGRTILYVSHNMNTVRMLCNRCIVLKEGRVLYQGDVESSIKKYMDHYVSLEQNVDLSILSRGDWLGANPLCRMSAVEIHNPGAEVADGLPLRFDLSWDSKQDIPRLWLRMEISSAGDAVGTIFMEQPVESREGTNRRTFSVDASCLPPGTYNARFCLYELSDTGTSIDRDCVDAMTFERTTLSPLMEHWNMAQWGKARLGNITAT